MLDTAHPETGERLAPENVRRQVLTFLIAGHETTSGALSFALHYLSRHPEVAARARAEVDRVWGATAVPGYDQVAKLRYVRRVLDESLRLWPTAPGFAREARHDTVLGGEHPMREGAWTLVLAPLLHRDPAVWGADAGRFDPDRFDAAAVRARPAHAFKPWGTGARACIGRQFALHEATLVLGLLLRRYDLQAGPGLPAAGGGTADGDTGGTAAAPRTPVPGRGVDGCLNRHLTDEFPGMSGSPHTEENNLRYYRGRPLRRGRDHVHPSAAVPVRRQPGP